VEKQRISFGLILIFFFSKSILPFQFTLEFSINLEHYTFMKILRREQWLSEKCNVQETQKNVHSYSENDPNSHSRATIVTRIGLIYSGHGKESSDNSFHISPNSCLPPPANFTNFFSSCSSFDRDKSLELVTVGYRRLECWYTAAEERRQAFSAVFPTVLRNSFSCPNVVEVISRPWIIVLRRLPVRLTSWSNTRWYSVLS
jgi:hypothetical protein